MTTIKNDITIYEYLDIHEPNFFKEKVQKIKIPIEIDLYKPINFNPCKLQKYKLLVQNYKSSSRAAEKS